MKQAQTDIAIVGGGITGLAAAYKIQANIQQQNLPLSYILVERESRLGGKILTENVGSFVVEAGPDCFISEKPAALRICQQLHLQDDLLRTNERYQRTYILWKSKLHPLPEGFMLLAPTNFFSFARDSLISPLGKLRVALDLVLPAKKSDKEETLAQFVRRRMGNEILEKIAEPLVAGIHAGNPETMSLKSTFPRFIEMEDQHRSLILGMMKRRRQLKHEKKQRGAQPRYTMFMTLKEGMAQISRSFQTRLTPSSILLEKQVASIALNYDSGSANTKRYTLFFNDGTSLNAQSVIITTPAYVAHRLLNEVNSALASELASIPYVSTATVSLAYREQDLFHPLDGFGFIVPRLEGRKIMASTWTSRKFEHRAPDHHVLIRCFVGGAHNESLALLDRTGLVDIARGELRSILGIQAEPLFGRAYRWEKSMPQYVVGHSDTVARIEKHVRSHHGLFLAGSAYRGIGISDCIVSGEHAALKALKFLKRASG